MRSVATVHGRDRGQPASGGGVPAPWQMSLRQGSLEAILRQPAAAFRRRFCRQASGR